MPFDNRDAVQIFLHDFLAGDFKILLQRMPKSFARPINGMLFNQHANLFREVGSRREFRDTLTSQPSFGEISLAGADDVMVCGILPGARVWRVMDCVQGWGGADGLIQPLEGPVIGGGW